MLVGTIIESRDAIFFENEFPMKITHDASSNEPIVGDSFSNAMN
jgi:hypothetical protein